MSRKPIFNEELIKPGSVIHLYNVDVVATSETNAKFFVTGIVERVDFSMIKYMYYSWVERKMTPGYIYPSDVYEHLPADSQWKDKERLLIFRVESAPSLNP